MKVVEFGAEGAVSMAGLPLSLFKLHDMIMWAFLVSGTMMLGDRWLTGLEGATNLYLQYLKNHKRMSVRLGKWF